MRVAITSERLSEVTAFLNGLENRLSDLSVPLFSGARRAREEIIQRITSGGASDGRPLASLAETTRERDRYRSRAGGVLNLSGRYLGSIRYFVEPFRGGVSLGPAAHLNEWGTTMPEVGRRGRRLSRAEVRARALRPPGAKKNPARPVVWISAETGDWIVGQILAYALDDQRAA